MHIPISDTQKIDVLTFEKALIHKNDSHIYNRDIWLYVPDFYSEYRYILGTKGNKPLICIGINPSTAEPDNLDNTLKSVERIAVGNGYDSFIMFNVYAQRATKPDDMDEELNELLHTENMKAFRYILERSGSSPSVWAAWGTIIEKRPYLKQCVKDMVSIGEKYKTKWFMCGKPSIKGHPHHPLYLKKDSILEEFNVSSYLKSI